MMHLYSNRIASESRLCCLELCALLHLKSLCICSTNYFPFSLIGGMQATSKKRYKKINHLFNYRISQSLKSLIYSLLSSKKKKKKVVHRTLMLLFIYWGSAIVNNSISTCYCNNSYILLHKINFLTLLWWLMKPKPGHISHKVKAMNTHR